MTRIEIIGNLGEDAKIKEFGEDKIKFISLSVAVTDRNKDNEKVTTWWYVLKRGDGRNILQYLKKGAKVFLRGEPRISLYKTKDGKHDISYNMYANELQLCGSPANVTDGKNNNSSADDLPF